MGKAVWTTEWKSLRMEEELQRQARDGTECYGLRFTQDKISMTLTPCKVMTNLDSILKSRDTILPTKVRLVKAMVFPVVMYGCESWTIKKAER